MTTPSERPTPRDLAEAVEQARAALENPAIALHHFEEVGSTNDVLLDLAERGAPEGTVVIAELQTAGRGRRGRSWHSPPGAGLYFSILFRPASTPPAGPAEADDTALITLMAGVAASEAIEAVSGLPAALKWPNDLVVEHPGRDGVRHLKLGGILAEGAAIGSALQHVIVGIGINLKASSYPPDLAETATSIERETGRAPDRGPLVARLQVALMRGRRDLAEGRRGLVLDRWRARGSASVGREVQWTGARGTLRGRTTGVDDDGALLVRTGTGLERIVAGEVTWL